MASPRFSVIAVVGGVLVAAAAGAYYFFAVFSADEQLSVARTQVEAWEKEWAQMRTCVLGSQPMADTFEDAIALRELSAGSAEAALGDCSKAIGKLLRPEGNATGLDGVERAWAKMEQLASTLAQRYVNRLTEARASKAEERGETFAATLEQMAKVRAELRRQVKLPEADAAMGPAVASLQAAPLLVGGEPLIRLDVQAVTAGGELLGVGATGGRSSVLKIAKSGAAVAIDAKPVGSETITPLPGAAETAGVTWGVMIEEGDSEEQPDSLFAGALDGQGEVDLSGKPALTGSMMEVNGVLGEGPERAVVVRQGEKVLLAESHDGGASWKRSELGTSNMHRIAGEGFLDLLWTAPPKGEVPGPTMWRRLKPGAPAATTAITGAELHTTCPAPGGPWALFTDPEDAGMGWSVVRLDASKPAGATLPLGELSPKALQEGGRAYRFVACDDRGAVLDAFGASLWSCRADRSECSELPAQLRADRTAVVGGAAIVATSRHQLVAVFGEDQPPRFARLPPETELRSLRALGGAPLLVLQRKDGALLAALL